MSKFNELGWGGGLPRESRGGLPRESRFARFLSIYVYFLSTNAQKSGSCRLNF